MDSDVSKVVGQFLDSEQGRAFSDKKDEISRLAAGRAGQNVLGSLSGEAVRKAVRDGEMDTIMSEVNKALSTPEGKEFYDQISRLINKK